MMKNDNSSGVIFTRNKQVSQSQNNKIYRSHVAQKQAYH